MATRQPEPARLVVALRAMFDLVASEHDGALAAEPVARARWKAVTTAWAGLGDEVAWMSTVLRKETLGRTRGDQRCLLGGAAEPPMTDEQAAAVFPVPGPRGKDAHDGRSGCRRRHATASVVAGVLRR